MNEWKCSVPTYVGLPQKYGDVDDDVDSHEDGNFDCAAGAKTTTCDGEAFPHQNQHQDERQLAHRTKHTTCQNDQTGFYQL